MVNPMHAILPFLFRRNGTAVGNTALLQQYLRSLRGMDSRFGRAEEEMVHATVKLMSVQTSLPASEAIRFVCGYIRDLLNDDVPAPTAVAYVCSRIVIKYRLDQPRGLFDAPRDISLKKEELHETF